MAYTLHIRSGQTYSRDSSRNISIEWTDEPAHRPRSGVVINNVHVSVSVYATLREVFDALAERYGRIVLYAYQDSPWGEPMLRIGARLPICPAGASAQILARRTANGTSYNDAIDDRWLT